MTEEQMDWFHFICVRRPNRRFLMKHFSVRATTLDVKLKELKEALAPKGYTVINTRAWKRARYEIRRL